MAPQLTVQPTAQTTAHTPDAKRLVVCCDGTWQNSNTGYAKPTLFSPGKLETPSNVTRISRSLRHVCTDGRIQVVNYQSGVGSAGSLVDVLTGGAFGTGIAENIREAYAFICANYADGDEIVLIGFSRGAFTARSVAGMISRLGLLTRAGMEYFYPIFKDMQSWDTPHYKDEFPDIPFSDKPRGKDAPEKYRDLLVQHKLTRVNQSHGQGPLIKVKAVAVWETVGSLGIPNITWLQKLGIHPSTKEYRFYDTSLSDRIEYAFQALALDEHRPPFSPTVWERTAADKNATELRQVWFPGNHGNVGGGWADAGVANMTLAWIMDQLASVGVEFDEATIDRIFDNLERYYRGQAPGINSAPPPIESTNPETSTKDAEGNQTAHFSFRRLFSGKRPWAINPIYEENRPLRPWALGELFSVAGIASSVEGYNIRTPAQYKRINALTGRPLKAVDPATGKKTAIFLQGTNERIHSSVRIRLALGGLGLDDKELWSAPALKGKWRLKKTTQQFYDPVPGVFPQSSEEETATEAEAEAAPVAPAANSVNANAIGKGWWRNATATPAAPTDPAAPNGSTAPNGNAAPNGNGTAGDSSIATGPERYIWEYCGPEADAPPPAQRILVEEPLGPYERELLRLSGGKPNVFEYAQKMDVHFFEN